MSKKLLLATLAAAVLLSACAPAAGTKVSTKQGSYGCQTWYEAAQWWVNCSPAGGQRGMVEDHPDGLGHFYNGRVRVVFEAGGIAWFEPGDLTVP